MHWSPVVFSDAQTIHTPHLLFSFEKKFGVFEEIANLFLKVVSKLQVLHFDVPNVVKQSVELREAES